MKIIEARLHELIKEVSNGDISFSRMAELINEEFAKPVTEEQAKINVDVMIRHCQSQIIGNEVVFTKESLVDYFRANAQSKNYNEYDQM